MDRMEAARPLAFPDSADMAGYTKYKGGWTQSQDPRAYGLDSVAPADRTALIQQMQAKAKSSNRPTRRRACGSSPRSRTR